MKCIIFDFHNARLCPDRRKSSVSLDSFGSLSHASCRHSPHLRHIVCKTLYGSCDKSLEAMHGCPGNGYLQHQRHGWHKCWDRRGCHPPPPPRGLVRSGLLPQQQEEMPFRRQHQTALQRPTVPKVRLAADDGADGCCCHCQFAVSVDSVGDSDSGWIFPGLGRDKLCWDILIRGSLVDHLLPLHRRNTAGSISLCS